jgi:LysM repeat protein
MRIGIQWGDTLSGLAAKYGTTVDALMKANPQIKDPNKIYAGDTLTIPADARGATPGGQRSGIDLPGSRPDGNNGAHGADGAGFGMPAGNVRDWIEQAMEILRQKGVPADKMNANDIWQIIQHESGGNPRAINNWDSNAARGTPSKGLMQTIDPTFNAHKLPGHDNVYNPVDNIIAGVRYAINRYGSTSNVPGIVAQRNGRKYVGY